MGYTINETLTAKNFTPHDQVLEVFGTARQTQSYTIHHWGALGQKGEDILAWFCNPDTTAQTSAHFVVWDGNIYCIVSPNDGAWAAGNAYGNATSIHIECRPEATDGDYATVAWLVAWLRNTYGDGPLFPHKHWVTTDCPGVWDLNRLDSLARNTNPNTETDNGMSFGPTDAVFKSKDGIDVSLQDILNSIDAKINDFPAFDADVRGDLANKGIALADILAKETDPTTIANAIPANLAQQVDEALAHRLANPPSQP